jgi:undecaprenyl-diphosphatase
MNLLEAIIIGIIQGTTEFLPISSDGHLVIVPAVFNISQPDLVLIGLVHAGTLVAILGYFRRDLWNIGREFVAGLVRRDPMGTTDSRTGWFMILGSLPAAIVGLLLIDFFERQFELPIVAAVGLLVTSGFLAVAELLRKGEKPIEKITALDTIIIGLFQILALFPGISRSGTTISAGLWRGLDRSTAARFSFLVGLPAIAGAGLLSIIDIFTAQGTLSALHYVAAFTAAAVTGYLCIAFLLSWLKNHTLWIFAIYCGVLGSLYLIFTFLS